MTRRKNIATRSKVKWNGFRKHVKYSLGVIYHSSWLGLQNGIRTDISLQSVIVTLECKYTLHTWPFIVSRKACYSTTSLVNKKPKWMKVTLDPLPSPFHFSLFFGRTFMSSWAISVSSLAALFVPYYHASHLFGIHFSDMSWYSANMQQRRSRYESMSLQSLSREVRLAFGHRGFASAIITPWK